MSLSPLLPIAGAAVGSIASRVTEGISNSFADVLQRMRLPGESAASGQNPDSLRTNSGSSVGGPTDSAALERFRIALTQQLDVAGVDLSKPVHLRGDGFGRLVLQGDHPDRAIIEMVLHENVSLAAMFNELAAEHLPPRDAGSDPDELDALQFAVTISAETIEVHTDLD